MDASADPPPTAPDLRPLIGRLEAVRLPDWGIGRLRAKIDTGARTSALHVDNLRRVAADRVTFEVVLSRTIAEKRVPVTAAIVRVARVRSSTGHLQERFVVATRVQIGDYDRSVELTLVDRQAMLCRMLLGRSALGDFLVDVTRKYLYEKPPPRRRARNS